MTTDLRNQSIIHATYRPQDLIPAFTTAIQEIDTEAHANFWKGYIDLAVDPLTAEDDDPFWNSEQASWLLEDLFDTLNALAPEGYYFGAHPGDGSDFGFWEVEENDV